MALTYTEKKRAEGGNTVDLHTVTVRVMAIGI